MPAAKPLSKQDILRSHRHTKSNKSAAKYLCCSYTHYKRYALFYRVDDDDPNSPTLFDAHFNNGGKGIPKITGSSRKRKPLLQNILSGGDDWVYFGPEQIKNTLVNEGFLREECEICNFRERRIIDYKIPLLLNFKDRNKTNYNLENLQLLCYNCYYLWVGDVFTEKQIKNIENNQPSKDKSFDFELDMDQLNNLKALGIDLD